MRHATALIILLAALMLASACGANEGILNSGKPDNTAPRSEPALTGVNADLKAAQTAGYDFIYVIRRRDGGKIDADDLTVLKANTRQANRRVASDDGQAVTIAANAALPPTNFAALAKRFAIEAYVPQPQNSNTGQNTNGDTLSPAANSTK